MMRRQIKKLTITTTDDQTEEEVQVEAEEEAEEAEEVEEQKESNYRVQNGGRMISR
jgi:hypothetical protein